MKYIEQLRQRIDSTLKVASDNSRAARERTKSQYDKRVTVRELSPNDLALVLLPTSENKLLATWSGPYKVLRGCGNGNYELQVGKRKATCHINSLCKYYVEEEREKLCAMIVEESEENEGNPQIVPNWATGGDREFTTGEQLTAAQRDAMRHLLAGYPDVFTDEPGKTDLVIHTIKLTDDKPRWQPSYRIPEAMKDAVEDELNRMLQGGIIQIDNGTPWNSPLVIVKKDNGKIRLVNNFIALNRKTIAEQYPMNNANELVLRVAGSQYISRIDLRSAYWQIKLAPESQKLTGFQTEFDSFFTVDFRWDLSAQACLPAVA